MPPVNEGARRYCSYYLVHSEVAVGFHKDAPPGAGWCEYSLASHIHNYVKTLRFKTIQKRFVHWSGLSRNEKTPAAPEGIARVIGGVKPDLRCDRAPNAAHLSCRIEQRWLERGQFAYEP